MPDLDFNNRHIDLSFKEDYFRIIIDYLNCLSSFKRVGRTSFYLLLIYVYI